MPWIFFPDAFVSIVAHRDLPDSLLVRARVRGDLEKLFPGVEVEELAWADYRFRAVIPRNEVAAVVAERVACADYSNLKARVSEPERHDAYTSVWNVMNRFQQRFRRGIARLAHSGRRLVGCNRCPWEGRRLRRFDLPCPHCGSSDLWRW